MYAHKKSMCNKWSEYCVYMFQLNIQVSLVMRKPYFSICESEDEDQLCGHSFDREADQRLCFCYLDSTIHVLLKSEISSL